MDSNEHSLTHDSLLEHAVWLRRLARELVRDPGAAEDLVQDTWLAALRSKPDGSQSLKPWLTRVMRNGATQRLRRAAGRLARESAVAKPEALPSAGELVVRAEQQRRLVDAVLALSEPYRQTLLLRFYEGLTPAQIAASLNVPPATIRTRLHRGLIQLREVLDRQNGGDRKAWVLMLQPLVGPAVTPLSVGMVVALAAVLLAVAGTWVGYRSGFWQGESGLRAPNVEWQGFEGSVGLVGANGSGAARQSGAIDTNMVDAHRDLQLLDARTGLPLADFLVRVDGGEYRSDALGSLRIPESAQGLVPVDDKRLALSVGGRHRSTIVREVRRPAIDLPARGVETLELPIGPSFHLQVLAPVRLELGELQASLQMDPARDGRDVRALAPIRQGEDPASPAFVRFAPLPQEFAASKADWILVVRDAAGHWMGQVALPNRAAGAASPLLVDLKSTALIQGQIGGLASPKSVGILLARKGDATSSTLWAEPRADGSFSLPHLIPGEYRLRVSTPLCAAWEVDLILEAGATLTQDVTLQRSEIAGGLSGIVRSQSGRYAGQLLVFLRDASGGLVGVFPTTWATDAERGKWAPFAFDLVPPGPLTMDVVSLQDEVAFTVIPAEPVAPHSEVDILLLDREPACDWTLLVVDANNGSALETVRIDIELEDGRQRAYLSEWKASTQPGTSGYSWTRIAGQMRWNQFEGPAVLQSLSSRARFTWTVQVEGFAPQTGDQDDFDADGEGGRTIAVRMRPLEAQTEKNK